MDKLRHLDLGYSKSLDSRSDAVHPVDRILAFRDRDAKHLPEVREDDRDTWSTILSFEVVPHVRSRRLKRGGGSEGGGRRDRGLPGRSRGRTSKTFGGRRNRATCKWGSSSGERERSFKLSADRRVDLELNEAHGLIVNQTPSRKFLLLISGNLGGIISLGLFEASSASLKLEYSANAMNALCQAIQFDPSKIGMTSKPDFEVDILIGL